MLHVVRAGGLEVEQDGNVAAELVEGREVEGYTCAAGYCDEVDQTVRGAADGLQDNHGVADGRSRDEVAGFRGTGNGEFGGALAGGFGDAAAVGESGWRGGAHGEREAEGFDDAGHRAGGAHDQQVPTDGQRRPLMGSISTRSMLPARCCAHMRRQSVQAPRTSPL